MKILHFADVHLGMENYGKFDPETGLNSRLGDFLNSFDYLIDYAIKNKVDLVVFAGDAYKNREPTPTYQKAFASRLYKIASADIPVVMLVGNHDFPNALGKAHTLDIYPTLNVKNIYLVGDEVKTIMTKSGPIQIAGLPWYTKQQLISKDDEKLPLEKLNLKLSRSLAQKVDFLSSKIDLNLPAILLAHATVEGSTFGSERSVMIGSDNILPLQSLKSSRFNYIALGHLHKHQAILAKPPVVYSGSLERVDFGEEKEDKGFVIIDINSKKSHTWETLWNFVKTPARKFLTINIKIDTDDNTMEKITRTIRNHSIADAIVKVIIDIDEEKQAEISESQIRESLNQASYIAGIIKEIKGTKRTQIKNGFSDELASLDTLGILEKYLKTKNVNLKHQELLIKTAHQLIEED